MPCAQEGPLLPYSPPALQQDDEREVLKNNEEDGLAVDIHQFNTSAYKFVWKWAIFDQTQDAQRPLRGVDPSHAAELEALFSSMV